MLNGLLTQAAKPTMPLKVDSLPMTIRKPSEALEQKMLTDKTYQYDRIGPAPKTPWERFKEWFWRKIGEIFDSKGGNIGVTIFEYALVAAAIVILVLLIVKNDVRSIFSGKSAELKIDFSEFEEDIHRIDFNKLIAEAIAQKDLRKAVRLHFLKLLKELSDKGAIQWQINKTNKDYSLELSGKGNSGLFKELVLLYEYIWYGDFQPTEQVFRETVDKFNSFRI